MSARSRKPAVPAARPAAEEEDGASSRSLFLRSLEVFRAVARTGGISAAARELDMGQPSVSQRVQSLEEMLGTELLFRRQTGTELTPAGRIVESYSERLLCLRDEMLDALRGYTSLKWGTLKISASTTPGNYLLPSMLQRFHEAHEGVRIVMEIGDSEEVVEAVRSGSAEIGVVGVGAFGSDLECEPLVEDEIVLVAHPSHPILQAEKITMEELRKHGWVVRESGSGTRTVVEGLLGRTNDLSNLKIVLEVSSTEAAKLAVRANMGISFVSRRAVDNEVALGHLKVRAIDGQRLTRHFFLLRHRSRTLSPMGEAFWNQLVWREHKRPA